MCVLRHREGVVETETDGRARGEFSCRSSGMMGKLKPSTAVVWMDADYLLPCHLFAFSIDIIMNPKDAPET